MVWKAVLGILNIIACVSLVIAHNLIDWHAHYAFTWGLPILIAALFALIGGILTMIKTSLKWAVLSLCLAGAAGLYISILLWLKSMSGF